VLYGSVVLVASEYLSGADLRATNLRRADLANRDLTAATFDRADLKKAEVGGAILKDSSLIELPAMNAYFNGANCHEAGFRDVKLNYAHLDGCDLNSGMSPAASLM
jgi:uncharacterized protein YjbI with pentapeptide repeats